MLFLIDNYDSFVHNIVHSVEYPDSQIVIRRNDQFEVEDVARLGAEAIILSPGPMSPPESGRCNEVIRRYKETLPILGICLGHQCIGDVFGCRVVRHGQPTHGKKSKVRLGASRLYDGLPSDVYCGRYHSLHIASESFNHRDLRVNARLEDGTIMGVEHNEYPIYGVQFHPESVLTGEVGRTMLRNFLSVVASAKRTPMTEAPRLDG